MGGYCYECLPRGKYRAGCNWHEGKALCQAHFLIATKGFVECPGCLGKGWEHPNGKRNPKGKVKCPLCKGARVLEPICPTP